MQTSCDYECPLQHGTLSSSLEARPPSYLQPRVPAWRKEDKRQGLIFGGSSENNVPLPNKDTHKS